MRVPWRVRSPNQSNLTKINSELEVASLVAQRLKRLPGMLETRVRSLGREDPLEKEMATHSSTLAWRIPWREEPGRLQSMGSKSRTPLSNFTFTFSVEAKAPIFWPHVGETQLIEKRPQCWERLRAGEG